MIENIVYGIAQRLKINFNPNNYKIYVEEVQQGFEEPCFFIQCINSSFELIIGNRYKGSYSFDVLYFPKDDNKVLEINRVLAVLYDCLEYINVDGDLIRGTKMNSESVDGVLNFFVNYNMFVYKVLGEEKLRMEELDIRDTGAKG